MRDVSLIIISIFSHSATAVQRLLVQLCNQGPLATSHEQPTAAALCEVAVYVVSVLSGQVTEEPTAFVWCFFFLFSVLYFFFFFHIFHLYFVKGNAYHFWHFRYWSSPF